MGFDELSEASPKQVEQVIESTAAGMDGTSGYSQPQGYLGNWSDGARGGG